MWTKIKIRTDIILSHRSEIGIKIGITFQELN